MNTPAKSVPTPPRRLWRDPRARAVIFQVLALAIVGWAGWTLFDNTLTNMAARGISTGFGFLDEPAGFGIGFSLIDYNETMSYGRTFWVGLLNTLLVSALGIFIATVMGFIIGIARLSSNWLVAKLALAYIEIFRNLPLLLQVFFWYFAVLRNLPSPRQSVTIGEAVFLNNRGLVLPEPIYQPGAGWVGIALLAGIAATIVLARVARRRQDRTGRRLPVLWPGLALVIGLPLAVYGLAGGPVIWELPELQGFNFRGGMTMVPELGALLTALSVYTAAFIAEIVRAGILSVDRGQVEAANALALGPRLTLRLVVIPQAMRVIIPPLTSQYLNLMKNSSLATAIGYPDLVAVFMGTTLNQTGQAVEIVAMTMAVYLVISLSISAVMNLYNRAMTISER